jgi:hypothetical protein
MKRQILRRILADKAITILEKLNYYFLYVILIFDGIGISNCQIER